MSVDKWHPAPGSPRRGVNALFCGPTGMSDSCHMSSSSTPEIPDIRLPADLLPSDGRFGCGPSKVRPDALERLAATTPPVMGTSHRKAPVRSLVGRVRSGLSELFALPDGHEVALGNGGAALFWDMASFSLIAQRSQHLVFGAFSSGFAGAVAGVPHLDAPDLVEVAVSYTHLTLPTICSV